MTRRQVESSMKRRKRQARSDHQPPPSPFSLEIMVDPSSPIPIATTGIKRKRDDDDREEDQHRTNGGGSSSSGGRGAAGGGGDLGEEGTWM